MHRVALAAQESGGEHFVLSVACTAAEHATLASDLEGLQLYLSRGEDILLTLETKQNKRGERRIKEMHFAHASAPARHGRVAAPWYAGCTVITTFPPVLGWEYRGHDCALVNGPLSLPYFLLYPAFGSAY